MSRYGEICLIHFKLLIIVNNGLNAVLSAIHVYAYNIILCMPARGIPLPLRV